ncbi:hypothetical protein ART_3206 [Arthrobacter sp. PAMC 25486]|nr:hypothetical protein ART_3206 [Arthrobacter sp. PAMC 25486]
MPVFGTGAVFVAATAASNGARQRRRLFFTKHLSDVAHASLP